MENPLTVQPESIREAAGYVWRQAREWRGGGGAWFESQGRTVINGGARRIVSFLCSCSPSRALTSVCASLSLSSKKLIKWTNNKSEFLCWRRLNDRVAGTNHTRGRICMRDPEDWFYYAAEKLSLSVKVKLFSYFKPQDLLDIDRDSIYRWTTHVHFPPTPRNTSQISNKAVILGQRRHLESAHDFKSKE